MTSVLRTLLGKAGPFIGLIMVIALFSVPAETRVYFLTYHNFKIILTQTVIVSIAALGMTLIIVSGDIDLSVGSMVALSGVVGALLIQHGWNAALVAAACIAVGGFVGLLNGVASAALRMPSFIITLGMLGIARGAAKWLANNQTVNYDASAVNNWMTTADPRGYALPPGVWVAVALAAATALVLRKTVFGRRVFALGSNEAAARLCGVPVAWTRILIFVVGGCFVGLSGLFQLSRLRLGDPTVAVGLELDIIAAVIIGGASLNGGSGTILGSVWPNYFQEIIIGLVIIVAVFLDRFRRASRA
jgi:ribose transport system permease protein